MGFEVYVLMAWQGWDYHWHLIGDVVFADVVFAAAVGVRTSVPLEACPLIARGCGGFSSRVLIPGRFYFGVVSLTVLAVGDTDELGGGETADCLVVSLAIAAGAYPSPFDIEAVG